MAATQLFKHLDDQDKLLKSKLSFRMGKKGERSQLAWLLVADGLYSRNC